MRPGLMSARRKGEQTEVSVTQWLLHRGGFSTLASNERIGGVECDRLFLRRGVAPELLFVEVKRVDWRQEDQFRDWVVRVLRSRQIQRQKRSFLSRGPVLATKHPDAAQRHILVCVHPAHGPVLSDEEVVCYDLFTGKPWHP